MSDAGREPSRFDFEQSTLPWIDKPDYESVLKAKVAEGLISRTQETYLRQWKEHGFFIAKQLISHDHVDAIVSDYHRIWSERPPCRMQVGDAYGKLIAELPPHVELREKFRMLDIHSLSEAARKAILHPTIVEFFAAIFERTPVAMQSLLFEYGSEQEPHQDFAFVPAQILSHLGATWIALEDIGPDQGPLSYFPGSHLIDKFDFGNGHYLVKDNPARYAEWITHLRTEMDRLGCKEKHFYAQKGDVLFWHAALVHGGSPISNAAKTRLSLVGHYSDIIAFPRDYRDQTQKPIPVWEGRGVCYAWRYPGHVEGRYSFAK